jgi:transposase
MKTVMYLGIDVDDNAFHGCGIFEEGGLEKMIEFKTKPSIGALMQKLGNFRKEGYELKVCYEATYLGFSIARDLQAHDIFCDVIAPSSIPTRADKTVKTDKIDSRDLAKFYKNGLLTIVQIPDKRYEQIRDLIRSRAFTLEQQKDLKRHILAICRRSGLDYKTSIGLKTASYFTGMHLDWLSGEISKLKVQPELKCNLKLLLNHLQIFQNQLEAYAEEIKRIALEPQFKKPVEALSCYRGIDVLSALSLVTELGDIKRFSHPTKLASYAGLDLREYSSGGKERRYSISKMGNSRIRTIAIEASQQAHRIPTLSKRLRDKKLYTDPGLMEVAERCMKRLHKKSCRMLHAGKPINKIKVACAREMLCFVWESLNLATAA